jgi:hypothetical protein
MLVHVGFVFGTSNDMIFNVAFARSCLLHRGSRGPVALKSHWLLKKSGGCSVLEYGTQSAAGLSGL